MYVYIYTAVKISVNYKVPKMLVWKTKIHGAVLCKFQVLYYLYKNVSNYH